MKNHCTLITVMIIFFLFLIGCDQKEKGTPPDKQGGKVVSEANVAKEAKAYQVLEIARKKRGEKRYEESLELFSQVLQLAPHLGMPGLLYVERGDIYQTLGRSPEALADYERAIAINPHKSFLIRHASVAYALGKADLVAEDVKQLEACCRDDSEVKQLMAQLASVKK